MIYNAIIRREFYAILAVDAKDRKEAMSKVLKLAENLDLDSYDVVEPIKIDALVERSKEEKEKENDC